MQGCLLKLQKAVLEKLRSAAELSFAAISAENPSDFFEPKSSDRPCEISVLMPIPMEASKYSAGPVFSKVALQVEIKCERTRMGECPSVLSAAEAVTRTLHFWSIPPESGYSRLSLSESSPWTRSSKNASIITVNFTACAVLG